MRRRQERLAHVRGVARGMALQVVGERGADAGVVGGRGGGACAIVNRLTRMARQGSMVGLRRARGGCFAGPPRADKASVRCKVDSSTTTWEDTC